MFESLLHSFLKKNLFGFGLGHFTVVLFFSTSLNGRKNRTILYCMYVSKVLETEDGCLKFV